MSQQRSWFGGSKPNYRSAGRGRAGGNKIKYMSVNPAMLVKKATSLETRIYTPKHKFVDFPLDPQIQNNIAHKGYVNPTPIQDQAIPVIMEGKDIIGLASTGTGKTAAFLLPLIDKIYKHPGQKVLIVTPTRELAVQILEEGRSFSFGTRQFFTICIGGVDIGRQVRELRRNPQFVVGTPGRLRDLSERRELKLFEYRTIVLDEPVKMWIRILWS